MTAHLFFQDRPNETDEQLRQKYMRKTSKEIEKFQELCPIRNTEVIDFQKDGKQIDPK